MIIKEEIKKRIPIENLDNLYFVLDFDRTITTSDSETSWSMISPYKDIPNEYLEEAQMLFNYYRPIELSKDIDNLYKYKMMEEWFVKHFELLIKYKPNIEAFKINKDNYCFLKPREYMKEFIKFLYEHNIPLIIMSAGVSNVIESFFKYHHSYYSNIHIIGNKILFKNNIATGIENKVIHSLNKNEASLSKNIIKNINNRDNVVLIGDQLSDLNMVNKDKHKSVFTICFPSSYDKLKNIEDNYDIVCEKNDNYQSIKKLLFKKNK